MAFAKTLKSPRLLSIGRKAISHSNSNLPKTIWGVKPVFELLNPYCFCRYSRDVDNDITGVDVPTHARDNAEMHTGRTAKEKTNPL